jgi:uncharacterized repeat protein (TIGR03803 family)
LLGLRSLCLFLILAGCSRGAAGVLPAGADLVPQSHTKPLKFLYVFKGAPDAGYPYGGLVSVDGALYGTTIGGGTGTCSDGCGTVFKITPGTERVLHSFTGSPDGASPEEALVDVDGTLYGTTYDGGNINGVIFKVSVSGSESVLYTFTGADGEEPQASLIEVNGALYGTTATGGSSGGGTLFKVTSSGRLSVLHNFGSALDGVRPSGDLIDVDGTLYGTTTQGGLFGGGTVYRITLNGHESVIHNFGSGSDGVNPFGGLAEVKGALYGTTFAGGALGYGAVFKIVPGVERVIYSFKGGSDGANPSAGLTYVNGALYGTTYAAYGSNSDGTVFKITPSGIESVLHNFTGADGEHPVFGRLIELNGVLYGTTEESSSGAGTVFGVSL